MLMNVLDHFKKMISYLSNNENIWLTNLITDKHWRCFEQLSGTLRGHSVFSPPRTYPRTGVVVECRLRIVVETGRGIVQVGAHVGNLGA